MGRRSGWRRGFVTAARKGSRRAVGTSVELQIPRLSFGMTSVLGDDRGDSG